MLPWLVLATVACGGVSPAPPGHTFASPDAAARAVLDALAVGDRDHLRQLALSEQEFRVLVWPELPASRPERNLPFEYVWSDLKQKSEASLAQVLGRYGGRAYDLVGIEFSGESTQYERFRVHRDSRLIVRDEGDREDRIRVFGSLLETQDGRFKVFSYVVD